MTDVPPEPDASPDIDPEPDVVPSSEPDGTGDDPETVNGDDTLVSKGDPPSTAND